MVPTGRLPCSPLVTRLDVRHAARRPSPRSRRRPGRRWARRPAATGAAASGAPAPPSHDATASRVVGREVFPLPTVGPVPVGEELRGVLDLVPGRGSWAASAAQSGVVRHTDGRHPSRSASSRPPVLLRGRCLGPALLLEATAFPPKPRIAQRLAVGLLHESPYPREGGFHDAHAMSPLPLAVRRRGRTSRWPGQSVARMIAYTRKNRANRTTIAQMITRGPVAQPRRGGR